MPIKTFRGKLADDTQDRLSLSTNNGKVGYNIVKFEVMGIDPDENIESAIKIYTESQSSITTNIDFSDPTLLAAATLEASVSSNYPTDRIIIFDREIVNQDIFITLKGAGYTASINWYLELEQYPLSENEATVATLKDIRNLA